MFTHVYGPLPKQLIDKALLINVFGNKKAKAEEWCGTELHEVGKWGRGLTNTIYEAGFTVRRIPLEDLVEEEFAPGRGWMPLELPKRLLSITVPWLGHGKRITVFDGFMGRATIGRAAVELGMNYVGIDRDSARVAIAREYLNI